MSRIADSFARCKAANRAAFIPFIMAGDPDAATTLALLSCLAESGADMIELGIPFSDPAADGVTIQEAGMRALAGGMTLRDVLAIATKFRAAHPAVPLVLMGYANPIYVYGAVVPSPIGGGLGRGLQQSVEPESAPYPRWGEELPFAAFAHDAAAAGVDGVIIVDLPPEESAEIEPLLQQHGVDLVRLIAPTSVPARLPLLTHGAHGYLYYISIAGITGAAAASTAEVAAQVAKIKAATRLPVCVGFGIKTPADVAALAPIAEGVVVGSALVKMIHETRADLAKIRAFAQSLSAACVR